MPAWQRQLWESFRLVVIITIAILLAQEIRGALTAQALRTASSSQALSAYDETLREGTAWARERTAERATATAYAAPILTSRARERPAREATEAARWEGR